MKLRQKILLFAVLPLLLALCAIALTVRHHSVSLAQQERKVIEPAYLATKDAELKNYVAIARRAIAHLYESGKTDGATKAEARKILEKLEYGEDGYFFLYDLHGNLLMHPKLKDWVGRNMWDIPDAKGNLVIRDLTLLAREGGGFYDYVWPKYSTGINDHIPKRAYVIDLPAWGWLLGSGVYLDDVDRALSEIDTQVSRNINDTMLWIAGIAFMSTVAIFLGLMLNIRERTALDDKLSSANTELEVLTNKLSLTNTELTALAQEIITARGEERQRIKEDLHDGIQQKLFATQMQLETAIDALPEISHAPSQALQAAKELLKEASIELRKTIDDMFDPGSGLTTELRKLALNMSQPTRLIKFNIDGEIKDITALAKKNLELFAREALVNIVKHANARQIEMRLEGSPQMIKLQIRDDGRGFDVNNSHKGHGLHNMRERLQSAGGQLLIASSSKGTCLTGTIPLP